MSYICSENCFPFSYGMRNARVLQSHLFSIPPRKTNKYSELTRCAPLFRKQEKVKNVFQNKGFSLE